jgi:transcription-repair coupling factor (superfamily II helicase)
VLDAAAASRPFQRLLAAAGARTAHAPTAAHAFAAAVLAHALEAPILAVAHDPLAADALAAGAAAFLGGDRVVRFPAGESLPYEGISPTPQTAGTRARAAWAIRHASGPLVVAAPVLAVVQGLPPSLGSLDPITVATGQTISPADLADRLVALGYERVDVVEHRGEFALRGFVADLFPSTARRPVRIEFDGDDVESLREFSPATQLSTGRLERASAHPARELVVTDEIRERAEAALPQFRGQFRATLERLAAGLAFEGMEQAIPLIHERLPLLADLLPSGSWVVLAPARRTRERARRIHEEADALAVASGWPGP